MTFTITPVGDNPFLPGASGYTYLPDQLIAGGLQLVTHNVLLLGGLLVRGTVIGRQSNYGFIAAHGTNTGNGTIGAITPGAGASVPPGLAPEIGVYTLVATSATTFTVTDPEGVVLGNATAGTPYVSNEINFTLTAGGTAFVAGDSFTITPQRGSGSFIACVKTATDGSQVPAAILADTCDATAGPVTVGAYFMGEFNAAAVTFDPSWLLPDLAIALQARAIHLKSSVTALDPS
jgi:hypothetical protein